MSWRGWRYVGWGDGGRDARHSFPEGGERRYREAAAIAEREGWDPSWIRSRGDVTAVIRGGCWFDEGAAWDAVEFIESFCCQSKDPWAGEPLILMEWQRRDVVMPLFGWKRADGTRRYRVAYIEIPRKNGKSTLASAIGLYLLVGDGEHGARIVSAAADKDQAREVFDEAKNMVLASPELNEIVGVFKSAIAMESTKSNYMVITAKARTKHGRNDHGILFDEFHAQPNGDLYKTLTTGRASRRQPLMFLITTAGDDVASICWEVRSRAIAIRDGVFDDDSFFTYIRGADDADTWWRLETWIKANPSLGLDEWIEDGAEDPKTGYIGVKLRSDCPFLAWMHARGLGDEIEAQAYLDALQEWVRTAWDGKTPIQLGYLVEMARAGLVSNSDLAAFKWLHLNQWLTATERWLSLIKWEKGRVDVVEDVFDRECARGATACEATLVEGVGTDALGASSLPEALKGRECFGGLDLGSTLDITAAALVFPPVPETKRKYPDDPAAAAGAPVVRGGAGTITAAELERAWALLVWFWLPEENIVERGRQDGADYWGWVRDGYLKTTEGDEVDYDAVAAFVKARATEYKIRDIGFDKWNCIDLSHKLQRAGLAMVEVPQTFGGVNEGAKKLEALVITEQLVHDGNPVMTWMVSNAVVVMDADQRIRPHKERSKRKIDGVTAAVIAMSRAIQTPAKKPSKYEESELVVLGE